MCYSRRDPHRTGRVSTRRHTAHPGAFPTPNSQGCSMARRFPLLALAVLLFSACAESTLVPIGGEAQFALLNALSTDESARLYLDGAPITLPASGARSSQAIPAG